MVRIALIILVLVSCLWADYVPGKIIVKLKSTKYSIQNLGNVVRLEDLPDSLQKLSRANGYVALKFLSSAAPRVEMSNFQTMDQARAYAAKVQAAEEKYGLGRICEITFSGTSNILFLVEQFKNDENVEYAQPDYIYRISATIPNDPDFANQTYLNSIYATKGWDICTGSASVGIAVIDTGVSTSHPDLVSKLVAGYSFVTYSASVDDDNGHGTVVAGIAAAIGNNSLGVCGVDWTAKIIPLKALNASGEGDTSAIAAAINWAVARGANVINMSFGANGSDPAVQDACDAAYKAGVLLVAATGNDAANHIYFPAAYNSVIAVGSLNTAGTSRSSFSNYGQGTELMAVGENIFTVIRNAPYYDYVGSGTSFAAPQVAGVCSLMIALYPSMSNDRIRLALKNSADDLGPVGPDDEYGYGRVNVFQALELISTYATDSPAQLKDVFNFPNPVTNGSTKFSFKTNKSVKNAVWTIYDLKGRELNTVESGGGMAGTYISDPWDCTTAEGSQLSNGTYIYVLKVTDGNDMVSYAKGKVSIVN